MAVSLDNYLARTEEQYEAAATATLALLKALLVRGWLGGQSALECTCLDCARSWLRLNPAPATPRNPIQTQGVLPAPRAPPALAGRSLRSWLAGAVVNVNVPRAGLGDLRGLYLARQGQHCHFPNFAVSLRCFCTPC